MNPSLVLFQAQNRFLIVFVENISSGQRTLGHLDVNVNKLFSAMVCVSGEKRRSVNISSSYVCGLSLLMNERGC